MALFQIAEPGLSAAPHEHRLAVGIDLGTTNSLAATVKSGEPVVLADEAGRQLLPSVVRYLKDGSVETGWDALAHAESDPRNTVYSAKRLLARGRSELKTLPVLPYEIVDAPGGVAIRTVQGDKSPVEVSAEILKTLAKRAETQLGGELTGAVITVPAYFDDAQRQATKDAGRIAGLEVLRIINEPTAASLAYGLEKDGNQKILVYDLGGGTFDVSILDIGDGVFEVLATNGNTRLGGDDFAQRIIDYVADQFQKENGIDLRKDRAASQRLKQEAEKAKIDLSGTTSANINLPFITADANGPKHLDVTITRAKFEELTADLVQATITPMEKALKDAGLTYNDISKIILVGGSTRIPAVQAAVKRVTGKEPFKGINPDECVAIGAAIQGGVLGGEVKDVLLLDVTPLSLGLETEGHIFTRLIDRNTTIPTSKSQVFSTAADGQTTVEINVLQGERQMAYDNKSLGRFQLTGIAPAPRGVPQIEVTFSIDANGIVNVSAKDKATGNEQKITITASSNLTEEEINQRVKEAEQYAEQDKKRKEEVETLNHADSMIYEMEKQLRENGDKLSAEDKATVESEIANFKKVREGNNAEEIKNAMDAFTQKVYAIFGKLYQQQGGEQGANPEQPQAGTQNADGTYEADGDVH